LCIGIVNVECIVDMFVCGENSKIGRKDSCCSIVWRGRCE
jgi:hypothetical protein